MSNSMTHGELIFIGWDVHKDSISVGLLEPGAEVPATDRIFHDEASVRRLVARFDRARLRVCYEAGPTGYGLARLLASMGIDCQVVAPSLIPTAPGDRVKTDKRDARRLARLLRAGELTPIRVPTPAEEGVRDLCRIRDDAVIERRRARQRLGGFLLRHGRVFRDGGAWTLKHDRWLGSLTFDQPAARATFLPLPGDADHGPQRPGRYRGRSGPVVRHRPVRRAGASAGGLPRPSACRWAGAGRRGVRFPPVPCCRDVHGLDRAGALRVLLGRHPTTGASDQGRQRVRASAAVESAWAYQHRPALGARLKARQDGLPPETIARSWKAQQRLCGKFRTLAARVCPGSG